LNVPGKELSIGSKHNNFFNDSNQNQSKSYLEKAKDSRDIMSGQFKLEK
jgi:hypothetical protein